MSTTIVAQVTSKDGAARWYWRGMYGHEHTEKIAAHPAHTFEDSVVPVDITVSHDGPVVGRVTYLESGLGYGDGDLWAVGVIDLEPDNVRNLYTSADINVIMANELVAEKCRLTALAICADTAGLGAPLVKAWPGDYRNRNTLAGWGQHPAILDRAAQAAPDLYQRSGPLRIHRPAPFTPRTGPRGPMHYSGGGRILAVR